MKTTYILVILFIGSLTLHSATVEVDGMKHQPNLECPTEYILDFDLMCVEGSTGEVVKPIKVSNIIIKGKGEECRVAIDSRGEIISTNCLQLTNSKKVKILCTKNKKMCKTRDELSVPVKKSNQSVNIKTIHITGNKEQCDVSIDNIGRIVKTTCQQLINSKKVKILCTKKKTMCKTVNELRASFLQPRYKPSYDCTKATTKTEKDICNSKTLSLLDLQLGNDYITMKKNMSKDTFSALISIQKEWIQKREVTCGKFESFKKRESCMLDMYEKRLDSFSLISVSNAELSMMSSFEDVYKNGTTDERFRLAGYYFEKGDTEKATKLFRKVFGERNEDMMDAMMALHYMHMHYAKTFPRISEELLAKNHNSIGLSLSELGEDPKKVKDVYIKEAYYLNAYAEIRIAFDYEIGIGEKPYLDKIFSFYSECAEDGVPKCQEFVGKVYLDGLWAEKDTSRGIKLLETASMGESYYILGNYFYAEKDIDSAKAYYLKAASMDHVESIYNLGVLSQMDKEYKEAIKYFNKAFLLDPEYYPNILELSRMYIEGWGTEIDNAKAIKMLEPVIEKTEDEDEKNLAIKNISIAEYKLGLQFLDSGNKSSALQYIESAANRNNVFAQYDLARMYYNGNGVEKNDAKVIKWYKRAAEQEHIDAQYFLALRYYEGKGVAQDKDKALRYWKKACSKSYASACSALGFMYIHGDGVNLDNSLASEYYKKACAGGAAISCRNLGSMYLDGKGMEKDIDSAAINYGKSCNLGDKYGCLYLANLYSGGQGIEKNDVMAMKLYKKVCNEGISSGCFNVGIRYAYAKGVKKDASLASKFYRKSCILGNMPGCYNLAFDYLNGTAVKKDIIKAVELKNKACNGNYFRACANLGRMYLDGQYVDKDELKAVQFFTKACDGKYSGGCQNLGYMYSQGKGVKVDDRKAVELYHQACDYGSATGCNVLGYRYNQGIGVKQDHSRAFDFYRKACAYGKYQACKKYK